MRKKAIDIDGYLNPDNWAGMLGAHLGAVGKGQVSSTSPFGSFRNNLTAKINRDPSYLATVAETYPKQIKSRASGVLKSLGFTPGGSWDADATAHGRYGVPAVPPDHMKGLMRAMTLQKREGNSFRGFNDKIYQSDLWSPEGRLKQLGTPDDVFKALDPMKHGDKKKLWDLISQRSAKKPVRV